MCASVVDASTAADEVKLSALTATLPACTALSVVLHPCPPTFYLLSGSALVLPFWVLLCFGFSHRVFPASISHPLLFLFLFSNWSPLLAETGLFIIALSSETNRLGAKGRWTESDRRAIGPSACQPTSLLFLFFIFPSPCFILSSLPHLLLLQRCQFCRGRREEGGDVDTLVRLLVQQAASMPSLVQHIHTHT